MAEPFTISVRGFVWTIEGLAVVRDEDDVIRDGLSRFKHQRIEYCYKLELRRQITTIFHEIAHAYHFHFWEERDLEGFCDAFADMMLDVLEAFFGPDAPLEISQALNRKRLAGMSPRRQVSDLVTTIFDRPKDYAEKAAKRLADEKLRESPLSTVEAHESIAPPSYDWEQIRECLKCDRKVAPGQITGDLPVEGPAGWQVSRILHCDHCNHLQEWEETSTRLGTPTGALLGKERYIRDSKAIETFLVENPEATGVIP